MTYTVGLYNELVQINCINWKCALGINSLIWWIYNLLSAAVTEATASAAGEREHEQTTTTTTHDASNLLK